MGGGTYSTNSAGFFDPGVRRSKSKTQAFYTQSVQQIFKESRINNEMSPLGLKVRESRDSDEHPNSLAIILGLDVTGSMGEIPHEFIKDGLPTMMGGIIEAGLKDPQVLFLGIGDHKCDKAPLQVGQFESSDELLDKWLTSVYIEGNGGGNYGESYALAWYVASRHTDIDCFNKRKKKGYIFTIGDDDVHRDLPAASLKHLIGTGEFLDSQAELLLKDAREKYEVYHFHVNGGDHFSGNKVDRFKELLGNHFIEVAYYREIPKLIAKIVSAKGFNHKHVEDKDGKEHTEIIL